MTKKGSYELRYTDNLRNCEDLVVDDKAGYVVFGCDEGRDVWNTVMVRPFYPRLLRFLLNFYS
jgi:arylesterase/paraoxonase